VRPSSHGVRYLNWRPPDLIDAAEPDQSGTTHCRPQIAWLRMASRFEAVPGKALVSFVQGEALEAYQITLGTVSAAS